MDTTQPSAFVEELKLIFRSEFEQLRSEVGARLSRIESDVKELRKGLGDMRNNIQDTTRAIQRLTRQQGDFSDEVCHMRFPVVVADVPFGVRHVSASGESLFNGIANLKAEFDY